MTGVICFTVEVALAYFKISVVSVTPSKIENTNHLKGSEGGGGGGKEGFLMSVVG